MQRIFDDHDEVKGALGEGDSARTKRPEEIPTMAWVGEPTLQPADSQRERIGPGHLFAGRYRVFDVKTGGMGRVYLAEDVDARRRGIEMKVAIKTVADPGDLRRSSQKHAATDAQQYAHLLMRFRREAMTWVRLRKHVNIILAMMVIEVGAKPYLVMEHADGGDLKTWIKEQRVGIPLAVNFARQFCEGMRYAVSIAGVVHRDIKPANVLISGNSILKIADFGLARAFDPEMTEWPWRHDISPPDDMASRAGFGTLPYMPPEQFRSLRLADTRSDIFSFATMFFEMLTKEHLFGFRNSYQRALNRERLPLAHEVNGGVPTQLSAIVDRCLRFEPAERYPSFDALAEDLTAFDAQWPDRMPTPSDEHQLPPELFTESIAILGEAYSLISLGEFEAAAMRAQGGIDRDPGNAEHWINKGKALAELRDFQGAQAVSRRATTLQPGNAIAWANLAWSTLMLGDPAAALEEAVRATRLDPGHADAWVCRGCCERDLGRMEDAVESLQWATRLAPSDWKGHANLGFVLTDVRRIEEGLVQLKRAAEINPHDAETWYHVAWTLTALLRHSDAQTAVDRCLSIDPERPSAWALRGLIVWKGKGDVSSARACLEKAISLEPANVQALAVLEAMGVR